MAASERNGDKHDPGDDGHGRLLLHVARHGCDRMICLPIVAPTFALRSVELMGTYFILSGSGRSIARQRNSEMSCGPEVLLLTPAGPRAEALRRARRILADSGSRFAWPTAMTTSTTRNDPPAPDAKPDAAAIEPPIACETQPELAVRAVASEADLESRIQQRRGELIATLGQLRADPYLATTEVRDRLKARLSELAHIIKVGVVDGWTNLSDTVKYKLEHWLAESERSMKDPPAKNR